MAPHQFWSATFLHASLDVRFYLFLLNFSVIAALSVGNLLLGHIIHGTRVKEHQLLVYAFSRGVDKILIKCSNY